MPTASNLPQTFLYGFWGSVVYFGNDSKSKMAVIHSGPDVNQLLVTKNYIQRGWGSFPQVPVGEISGFFFGSLGNLNISQTSMYLPDILDL